MDRFAKGLVAVSLLAATGLHAGCGNTAAGVTSTSAVSPPDAPQGVTNESPQARPVSVAWTAARAQRCGFFFDAAKLRNGYLTYEGRQGAAGEELGKIERAYDLTYKVMYDKVASDPDYCTDKRGLEIKADLNRHLGGDYSPNLPKPKIVANCGMFGCAAPDEKFDTKKFWSDSEKKMR
jgi:hypothetical protein